MAEYKDDADFKRLLIEYLQKAHNKFLYSECFSVRAGAPKGMTPMINRSATNYHVEYMDVTQYWSPRSQQYAGCDALITALANGWEMKEQVVCEEHWYAGMRQTLIYHVELHRNDEKMTMPILHNPYVDYILSGDDIQIVMKKAS
jgi:hypothetical protein